MTQETAQSIYEALVKSGDKESSIGEFAHPKTCAQTWNVTAFGSPSVINALLQHPVSIEITEHVTIATDNWTHKQLFWRDGSSAGTAKRYQLILY